MTVKLSICLLLLWGINARAARDSMEVDAYSDGFHTFIVFPESCAACTDSFVQYEYAEKAWYLDGRTKFYRVFPVLFTKTPGTVGERRFRDGRFMDAYKDRFVFRVAYFQYTAMRQYAESWIDRNTIYLRQGGEAFYGSTRPYTLRNSCHTFVLKTLKAGGVPVAPSMGLTDGLAVRELRKAAGREKTASP